MTTIDQLMETEEKVRNTGEKGTEAIKSMNVEETASRVSTCRFQKARRCPSLRLSLFPGLEAGQPTYVARTDGTAGV